MPESLAATLIKQFEGCKLRAYPDPATGGKPFTVGYGCTGSAIGAETVWTQEQADAELEHRLASLQTVVASLVHVPVTPNQTAALCSLAWNIGTHAFSKSTVLRELNAGNVQASADAFLNWESAAGKHMDGLARRREAERAIFLKP